MKKIDTNSPVITSHKFIKNGRHTAHEIPRGKGGCSVARSQGGVRSWTVMIPSCLKHQQRLNLVSSLTSSNLNILKTNPSDLCFQKEEKPRMPEQTIEDQSGQWVFYWMLEHGLKKSAVLKSHQKIWRDRNLFFFRIFLGVTFGFVSSSLHLLWSNLNEQPNLLCSTSRLVQYV